MHREIAHSDAAFEPDSPRALYLMTGLLAVLVALDLAPRFLGGPADLGGYRFALIAAVLGGARVVYGSLQSLLAGRLGADLALAIACLSAILINEPLVAAEVVLIGMAGECLEAFTFARTQRAIRKIVEVFPRRCWLLRDGRELRVFTHEVRVGDVVVVKPGAKVPVDGVVGEGRSAVDTSALTGESLPVDKGPGDAVLAGSVNQFGSLTITAERVAEQTVAGRVVELTARALRDKGAIERTADRLARVFLPAVLGLAAATFLAYFAFHASGLFRAAGSPRLGPRQALLLSAYPTLSVLVVACPCALILATPAAVIAALGRLAGTGVLVKSGAALEKLARVSAFAFDKTGTITEGRLELGDLVPLGDVTADELLRVAASAEQRSEHPLARPVVQAAQSRGLPLVPVGDFQALPGAGVVAQLGDSVVVVGTRRLLEERGILVEGEAEAALDRLDAGGQTPLLVARDGRLLGVVGARDRLRPEAAGLLAELRGLGIDPVVLLTGDRPAAAQAVARDVPFSAVFAELLPDQKAEQITRLKASAAGLVAMVGDGINDAPALARADVGLALSGVDLAAEAGDLVLLGDPLRTLPLLIRLSRETVRIIRQNIVVFAFGVNLVGVALTAWLWPLVTPPEWYEQSPLAAVVYHQLGSLAVLLNSMRLLWFERAAEGPRWQRLRDRLRDLDRRMERWSLDELLHGAEHRWRGLLLAGGVVLLLLYLATGFAVVAPDEVAVVRRFGQPAQDLTPGWHLRLPWPVETVDRVSQQVRSVALGFRELPERGGTALTWASAHRKDLRLPDEALMMTGDGNLVDLLVTIRYKVVEPRAFLYEVREPEELIRAAAESAVRGMVAGRPFLDLLTVERARFPAELQARLQARCDAYGSRGLGVAFEGISIIDLHPPGEVVEAYDEVARAMQGRDRQVNEAQERATARLKTAEADAAQIVARARARAAEAVQQAATDRTRFLARLEPRRQLDREQEVRLAVDAVGLWLRATPTAEVERRYAGAQQKMLDEQKSLTDFRLYWEALGQALEGREMLLIDAEKVAGRRHLMLFDPELTRPPLWTPTEKR